MGWVLGVDLGTTFTAAASWRDGRAEIISLGTHTAAIPSVVLFREDGSTMFGDAAELRSVTEPERVAREFKRRVGDSTPLMIGGSPRSAESVMGVLLRAVANAAVQLEGSRPDRIAVTHPASWGQYKLDVLRQAVQLADLGVETEFVPEPVAAAVHYSTLQRVELHDFVAVYDLGGGTFDAAVVRRTEEGFDLYGKPEGIERLGGIDVDAAVFSHVQNALGLQLDNLDRDDSAVVSAFARLRSDCVAAKEALSADADAVIPVMLPGLATEVRITRSELETMIRPAIRDTIAALRRAITSGGLVPEHLARVLLVGGSSRIPLVGEMVNADLARPIALDTHPKHAVALGAAITVAPSPVPAAPPGPVLIPPPVTGPPPSGPPPSGPPSGPPPPGPPRPEPTSPPPSGPPVTAPIPTTAPSARPTPSKRPMVIAAIVVAVLLLGVGALALSSGGDDSASSNSTESTDATDSTDSTDSTGDSTATNDFPIITEDDVELAGQILLDALFTYTASDVDTVQSQLLALTTGSLADQVAEDNSSFVSSVQENDTISIALVGDTNVRSIEGDTAVSFVDFQVDVEDFAGNSSSSLSDLAFLIIFKDVDGTLLAAEIVDCSEGEASTASDFSDLGSNASC